MDDKYRLRMMSMVNVCDFACINLNRDDGSWMVDDVNDTCGSIGCYQMRETNMHSMYAKYVCMEVFYQCISIKSYCNTPLRKSWGVRVLR